LVHQTEKCPVKKIASSGGRRENFWGISCEKSQFYAKKIIFFPIAEGSAKIVEGFRVKNHDFTPKNLIFSNFRGGARRVRPSPWIRPWAVPAGSLTDFYVNGRTTDDGRQVMAIPHMTFWVR
jgi:hypothetical protein